MNNESYVGKECFYIDKTTHGKIYQNRELGVCLEETIDRDNETFSKSGIEIHNEIYHIWLQYSYDEYGYEIAPYFGYSNSDKLIPQNLAYIREEILDEIILKLKTIKEFN